MPGREGATRINRKGKRKRNRRTGAYSARRAPEASHRHPRRRRGTHRHLRELTMPIRKRKPTSPGRRFQTVVRLRRGHQDQAREVAHEAEAEDGWSQLLRPHDVAAPRWRSQAALPHRRLPPEQGRRAREGRGDRVRPEPQRAHRAAALPRRREALHHRPAGSRGRRPWCRAARAARSASATRCRCATSPSARRCTTSSSSPARGAKMGRGAGTAIQLDRQGRRVRDAAPAVHRDAARADRLPRRRSARSATARPA